MESTTGNTIPPLPDASAVMKEATLLKNYYALYSHYFFEAPLAANFPESIVKQFPNPSYKVQLKNAIASQTVVVNNLISIQQDYISDYFTLYNYFAFGGTLPATFPESIFQQFPNKSFQQQLKTAIIELQGNIAREKAEM
ncbi:hypothetical protein D3C87_701170 [compost metagenome]